MVSAVHSHSPKDLIAGVAVTTLVILAALSFTVLGPVMGLFIPLPILFYRSKLGRQAGLLILGAVSLIVMSLLGWRSIGTGAFLLEVGLVGLVLPEMFEMDLSVEKTVGITAGVVLLAGAVMLGLYSLMSGTTPWDVASDYLQRSATLFLDTYKEMEPSDETINLVSASMEGILYVVIRIIPALLIVCTLFLVWSNLLLARPLLKSRQLTYPDFGQLNEWKAPERLVWVAIVSAFLFIVSGMGITEYNLMRFITFGLLTKDRSFLIHTTLLYPFTALLFLHIYYAVKPRLKKSDR